MNERATASDAELPPMEDAYLRRDSRPKETADATSSSPVGVGSQGEDMGGKTGLPS